MHDRVPRADTVALRRQTARQYRKLVGMMLWIFTGYPLVRDPHRSTWTAGQCPGWASEARPAGCGRLGQREGLPARWFSLNNSGDDRVSVW
jgi:hypothetical protein